MDKTNLIQDYTPSTLKHVSNKDASVYVFHTLLPFTDIQIYWSTVLMSSIKPTSATASLCGVTFVA